MQEHSPGLTEPSPEYPVSVAVWFDANPRPDLFLMVNGPEQSDHWMQVFMADHWFRLQWYWRGVATQVVERNPADRYDPLILEVNY